MGKNFLGEVISKCSDPRYGGGAPYDAPYNGDLDGSGLEASGRDGEVEAGGVTAGPPGGTVVLPDGTTAIVQQPGMLPLSGVGGNVVQATDAAGNLVYDASGNPVYVSAPGGATGVPGGVQPSGEQRPTAQVVTGADGQLYHITAGAAGGGVGVATAAGKYVEIWKENCGPGCRMK